ncbi:MAG TPA: nitroreductase [Geminicoccaceae bacterium]|nr:nitroreductase [Geminicoccus sp.]HMU48648.1 nitroreductase [Geminicoccaceae bacterium]
MQAIEAILGRRTVPQVKMAEPGPDEGQLRLLLEAGCAAPDHGRVRPWRFLLVRGEARRRLGELFADAALAADPAASAADLDKQRTGPSRAPLIVVVAARIDRRPGRPPEVEQISASAAAAQNILLAAHAMGFAGKWSTGRNAYMDAVKAGLGLASDDHLIGFLYIGSLGSPQEPSPRPDLAGIVSEWRAPSPA